MVKCSSLQEPLKLAAETLILSTQPTGAVMFHWQVAFQGKGKELFGKNSPCSVGMRFANDCWLKLHPAKIDIGKVLR